MITPAPYMRHTLIHCGRLLLTVFAAFTMGLKPSAALDLELLHADFDLPLLVTHAGDKDDHLYVVEKTGRVYQFDALNKRKTLYLDASSLITTRGEEQGLLSIAFHPEFDNNGYLFIYYTARNGDNTLARLTVEPKGRKPIDLQTLEVLIAVEDPASNHNGGMLVFGKDGYLYLGMGDGGRGGDPWNNAQDLSTLLGKMLRIDVNQAPGYSIPADNPFNAVANARAEIWSYGLRNPWRHSIDPATGDLWIADVGQNKWEEINWQPARSEGGHNYGWRRMEGKHCFKPKWRCDNGKVTLPIAEYPHKDGCSVTGGYVYRGRELADLQGLYVFGDFCTGTIWAIDKNNRFNKTKLLDTDLNISSFGEDQAGEIYVVDYGGGIYKLVN